MNKRKLLSQEETDAVVNKLKSGASINTIRNETGYGVGILKRIRDEKDIPYTIKPTHKGQVTKGFEHMFSVNSGIANGSIIKCIKQHNLIQHSVCHKCGLSEWIDGVLVLEMDHINGNNRDHRLTNLRFLCPNCHSQTPTYKGKGINNGQLKVCNSDLINSLKKNKNIHSALKAVGLTPKGGNYKRAYRIAVANNITI